MSLPLYQQISDDLKQKKLSLKHLNQETSFPLKKNSQRLIQLAALPQKELLLN